MIIIIIFMVYLWTWIWFIIPKDLDYKPINLTHPYFYIMPFMFAPVIRGSGVTCNFMSMFMPWILVWFGNIFNRILKGEWVTAWEQDCLLNEGEAT